MGSGDAVKILENHSDAIITLTLAGRLILSEGSQLLDDKVQLLVAEGCRALLLDCSQVLEIDSAGLRVLVRTVVSFEKRGGALKLLRPSQAVRRALATARLLDAIEVFDNPLDAHASFHRQSESVPNKPSAPKDLRRFPRVPADLLAQVEDPSSKVNALGRLANLSEGGVLLTTKKSLALQTELDVRFILPPGQPVEATGVVMHRQPDGSIGVQFLLVGDEARQAIANYVQKAQSPG